MKRGVLALCSLFILSRLFAQEPSLVPLPLEVSWKEGQTFSLGSQLTLYCDFPKSEKEVLVRYLQNELKRWNITLTPTDDPLNYQIGMLARRMPTGGKPAYRLIVDSRSIRIESNFGAPAFHGIQTLLQLFPATGPVASLPQVEIFDHARFQYRGMHLDVSRHFFPVSFIKKYIDYLAYHKLNFFHWHLTEDQGWRIEIKKYPELTSIGAWRNGTIIGRYPGQGNDNVPYGGYYTQEEVREVVRYAADRYIEVIPEFDMPGHTGAAIAAYPSLSCFPGKPTEIPASMISQKSIEQQRNGRVKLVQETWGIFDDVLCAGNDSTFLFIENVLDEMVALFPSRYFHVGGDECPKTHWKQCPKCQQRIRDLGLKDEHELQSYFIQRVEKYLNQKQKTIIGWDEILEGGLAPNAIVMSWRGEKGGIEAARQQHYVIMTPGSPLYFDHTQSENEDSVTIGGYNPIEKVYAYDPIPAELTPDEAKFIMGAQANLWTEYIRNPGKVEYMLFPRMAALSEVLWTDKSLRNWKSFEKRLPAQIDRYRSWGANYSNAYYDVRGRVIPLPGGKGIGWVGETRDPASLTLAFFQKTPAKTNLLRQSFEKSDTVEIAASGAYLIETRERGSGQLRSALNQSFTLHRAAGKKIVLANEPSASYPGDGAFTLVNAVINTRGFSRTKEFLGWSGKDCEAVIDLGASREISEVTVHALRRHSSWIWEPAQVEVMGSADGEKFVVLGSTSAFEDRGQQKIAIRLPLRSSPYRFLKIRVKNYGKIPEGNAGAGRDAWLFIDEIEVN